MRISNVTLYTFDNQLAGHRATTTVFNHVTDVFDRGWFANDAVVELFSACFKEVAHNDGAINGGAFFIASD